MSCCLDVPVGTKRMQPSFTVHLCCIYLYFIYTTLANRRMHNDYRILFMALKVVYLVYHDHAHASCTASIIRWRFFISIMKTTARSCSVFWRYIQQRLHVRYHPRNGTAFQTGSDADRPRSPQTSTDNITTDMVLIYIISYVWRLLGHPA